MPVLPVEFRNTPPGNCKNVRELMLHHASNGWHVFPLAGKNPYADSHGAHDATQDPMQIARWAAERPDANVGGACIGKLVLDIDPRSEGSWDSVKDLPKTRKHLSGRGDGGGHLIYALTDKQIQGGVKTNAKPFPGVDTKSGAGSYVVLPGSRHPEGHKLLYTSDETPIAFAPDELVALVNSSRTDGGSGPDQGTVRSLLTTLLSNPPQTDGDRNNWLTRVAGHYAKSFRQQPDVYWTQLNIANGLMGIPLDAAEVDKIGGSIWNTEMSGHPERDVLEMLNEDNGFLASGDYCLIAAGYPSKQDSEPIPMEWSNFDLKLISILQDPDDDSLTYEMLLLLAKDRTEAPIYITAGDFGDPRSLRKILASRSAIVSPPDHPVHRTPDWASRLHLYVRSQPAPTTLRAAHLGWSETEEGFLTLDGVIDANGSRSYSNTRPDPALRQGGSVHQEYGMAADAITARDMLSRVSEFHEDEIVAIFGSWWAANWCKHILRKYCTMFPVMAIEAASESGKTTGYFSLMVALSGSTIGEGHFTVPTLRNSLAANYNGITWVDDLDNPRSMHEIIRVLTSNGTLTKMAANSMDAITYNLVGSLVISGESLEIRGEKALLDRCIILEPPNPSGRMSNRPGFEHQSQWMDVIELRNQMQALGGGQQLAGHFISATLGVTDVIDQVCQDLQRKLPSGRSGERLLCLSIGARLFDYLLAPERDTAILRSGSTMSARIDDYIERLLKPIDIDALDEDTDRELISRPIGSNDNALTLRVLPAYFNAVRDPEHRGRMAFVQDGEIWFNVKQLSHWWTERHHGRINSRLESEDAMTAQIRALRNSDPKSIRTGRCRIGDEKRVHRFWVLSGDLAKIVIMRAG